MGARQLPEMLFSSELSLTHEASGVALVFNATEALREWKVAHTDHAALAPQP